MGSYRCGALVRARDRNPHCVANSMDCSPLGSLRRPSPSTRSNFSTQSTISPAAGRMRRTTSRQNRKGPWPAAFELQQADGRVRSSKWQLGWLSEASSRLTRRGMICIAEEAAFFRLSRQKGPAGGGPSTPLGVSGRRAPSAASVVSASGIRIRSAWNGFLHRRSLEDSGRSDFTENGELESNLPRQHPLWLQRGDTRASSIVHEPMIPIDPDVGQEGRDLF
jgi:hypothetical protein